MKRALTAAAATDLSRTARALGARFAVAGGSLVALLALLGHAPVWIASLRGAGTFLVLSVASRLGARALECAIRHERSDAAAGEESRP